MTTYTIQGMNLSVAYNNANTVQEFIAYYKIVCHGEILYSDEQLMFIYDAMCDISRDSE